MKKVGFFKSIYFKFVLIYLLLIFVAMQIIGVYFAQRLEQQLVESFESSIQERVTIMKYSLEKEITETRKAGEPTLMEDIKTTIGDYDSEDISEIRVMDQDYKVIGSSAENQEIVGTRFTDKMVMTAFNQGTAQKDIRIDPSNADRILLWSEPLMTEDGVVIGNLYLVTKIENVYKELEQINTIMGKATII